MTYKQLREMVSKGLKYYPTSKNLRRQWVRKTVWLIERKIYALHLPEGQKYPSGREA